MTIKYPKTKKINQTDNYFGIKVSDPYRWLEDENSAKTKKWVESQNKLTSSYLSKIPYRENIKNRLKEVFDCTTYSAPFRKGKYYFFEKTTGLQNQSVIYYQKGLSGKPKIFLDPNKFSKDGTVAVNLSGFSKDRKYAAYSHASAGSDWNTTQIMEVSSRKILPDKLEWIKSWFKAAWKGNGFYYSRYDKPEKGKEYSQRNEHQKLYYHTLGTKQENDRLVYEDKKHPLRYYYPQTTTDERFLIIYTSEGTQGYELRYKDFKENKSLKLLFKGFNYNYSVVDNIKDKLLILTNYKAPSYKLILVDPKKPQEKFWKNVIPEANEALQYISSVGGKLFAIYLHNATSKAYVFSKDGKEKKEIKLPGIGSTYGFYGEKNDKNIFYTFTSFIHPQTIYKYDIKTNKSTLYKKTDIKFNPSEYVEKQIFYKSHDGTKIPMFIMHKKGINKNKNNPVYLYGYGGFNYSITPEFISNRIILLEQGVIIAEPSLRGGGEYGEKWHQDGMLLKKKNTFKDFIAAADYLIKEGYTSKKKIAIAGASNGGLLVGACMTMRPDLFGVCLPAVGVMDMLRFNKFTVGWGWVVEYGSVDDKKNFQNLYSYSPLHNIRNKTAYPATFITTADHDDRVIPAHSFKFTATLQEKNIGENPILIRIETKAGHGAGKPLSKIIEEKTDEFSFTFYNLGVKPTY